MRHEPSVFEDLMKGIPSGTFDRLVAARGADDRTRSFNSRDHLMAMLPCLQRADRREMREAVRLIDSTQVNLGLRMCKWVGLHRGEPTAKIHVVCDPRAGQPVYFALTAAKVSDIAAARQLLPTEAGATYVFHRGYYDFAVFAKLRDKSCTFVTRRLGRLRLHWLPAGASRRQPTQPVRRCRPRGGDPDRRHAQVAAVHQRSDQPGRDATRNSYYGQPRHENRPHRPAQTPENIRAGHQ